MRLAIVAAGLAGLAGLALPSPARADDDSDAAAAACIAELDQREISYHQVRKKGVAIAVEVDGTLGGVDWHSSSDKPLLLDCSLAVSLHEAGRYLLALGITEAVFSSSYSVRNVRGTRKPSKHSYALAIDVNTFIGPELGTLAVKLDYEQGLGDSIDCLGQPLTAGGAVLKTLQCQLVHSGLFRLVLSPDYDDAHHDHFHLEARRWPDRATLRGASPAIH